MRTHYTLHDQLNSILEELSGRIRGVKAVVIADPNGLPLASRCPTGLDPSMISAVGTLLTQAAESAFDNMRFAIPEVITIKGKDAHVAAIGLPEGMASLIVLLEKHANVGLAEIEMRRSVLQVGLTIGAGMPLPPRITELFILYNGGALIRHFSDTLRTESDRDILGGMLSAVQSFVRQILGSKDGALDEMRFGEYSIGFVRGERTIAAYIVGEGDHEAARYAVFDALKDFEEKYRLVLTDWKGFVQDFQGIDECFVKVLRSPLASY